jgi:hypothetical protein
MAPEAPGKCRLRRIMDSVTVSGSATGSLCSIEAVALTFRLCCTEPRKYAMPKMIKAANGSTGRCNAVESI